MFVIALPVKILKLISPPYPKNYPNQPLCLKTTKMETDPLLLWDNHLVNLTIPDWGWLSAVAAAATLETTDEPPSTSFDHTSPPISLIAVAVSSFLYSPLHHPIHLIACL